MSFQDCARIRAGLRSGSPPAATPSHLFRCGSCRADARLAAAWRSLGQAPAEEPAPVSETFVGHVLDGVRRDTRRRRGFALAAAAALFLFCLGAGVSLSGASPAGAEETYSRLADSSTLDGLLPE